MRGILIAGRDLADIRKPRNKAEQLKSTMGLATEKRDVDVVWEEGRRLEGWTSSTGG